MGTFVRAGVIERSGAERAVLVRRTYTLVFVSILVTIAGAAFGMTQPSIMQTVIDHPFITFLLVFAPLMLATRVHQSFPANIGLVFLFTFAEGVLISPLLFFYGQRSPGIVGE